MSQSFYFDERNVYRAHVLDDFDWLEHGFGTRLSPDWLAEREVTTLRQVHSNVVLEVKGQPGSVGDGDALIANSPGLVGIRTADCLPILLVDPVNRALAAVHAGWRGTAAGICTRTVTRMQHVYETNPNDLVAVIGPGIGHCCFEVGPEVTIQFQSFMPAGTDLTKQTQIDLASVNRSQLQSAGLEDSKILAAEICTFCGGDFWHSYRRDGKWAGRMTTAIGLRTN